MEKSGKKDIGTWMVISMGYEFDEKERMLEEYVYKIICERPGIDLEGLIEITKLDTMKLLEIIDRLKRKGKIWAVEWHDPTNFTGVIDGKS